MSPEPRQRDDYSERQIEAAHRVLIDVGQVLASFADCLVVVGGWVPDLLLPEAEEPHVGSIDVDLALDAAKLSEEPEKLRITQSGKTWDLSKIDFEKLKEDFQTTPHKNIEIADLRAFIQKKLEQMLKENATRTDFATRLQGIVDRYNAGSSSADQYFNELMEYAKGLREEAERHLREGLTEDELELFDLIKKDRMTREEKQKVRLAAQSLLHRLRSEPPKVLVQDWFKDSQSQKRVRSAVEAVLEQFPEVISEKRTGKQPKEGLP